MLVKVSSGLMVIAKKRAALRRVNRRDGRAALFYFHPWELDPAQPRVPGVSLKTRFRHYLNLHRVEPRLARLLADFRWDRMDRVFPVEGAASTHRDVFDNPPYKTARAS